MTAVAQHQRLFGLALLGIAPFLINGLVNSIIADSALFYWAFEILTWVVIPLLILCFALRFTENGLRDFGLHASIRGHDNAGRVLVVSVLFAPLCYGVYRFSWDFFSAILTSDSFFDYGSVVPESGLFYYVVVIYFALSAGLVEEFLFRGLLWKAFSGFRHSLALFLVVSPILFSLVHWENGFANLAATYVYGVFMALAYLGLRNLWPLIVGHVFTDLVWFG